LTRGAGDPRDRVIATEPGGEKRYQLGIDIGGTFTDLSLLDRRTGQQTSLKTPTVPADPTQGVATGIALLTEQGILPSEIGYFVHGTTIGVNAVIQRSGARIALLVTEGFRDVLEMARLRLPTPWDFYGQRPSPLLPRELVIPVRERMRYGGFVETSLTDVEIERVISKLTRLEVEGVAICLLHAYANPAHELALKTALEQRAPHLFVSCSAEIWPQMREYERALVTVMNAYIRPPLVRYLSALEGTLQELGIPARPYLTRSNGGIMTAVAAREHPVQTLLSGPASGVIGAAGAATRAGFADLISFDMGGTSADIALVTDGQIEFSREAHVGDFPLFLPVVGVSSIGAGGGSIAWLDGAGVLKVGPQSAGADPGPACYGLGGEEPTLSDAFLLCGYLNPVRFAGKARLDEAAASVAMDRLAGQLALGIPETARGVIRVALATMFAEFSAVLERRGIDPRDFTLVAFGGAGPVVACLLAEEVKISRVLVPPAPGTLAALGARHADVAADLIRTVHWRLDQPLPPLVLRAMNDLQARATTWLEQEAPTVGRTELRWAADMRYVGQSYEIETSVTDGWLRGGMGWDLADAFHEAHQRIFNHADLDARVEMVNLRVRAVGLIPVHAEREPQMRIGEADASGRRPIAIKGGWHDADVYQRDALGRDQRIAGPAIVEQPDTTTIIPTGWVATVDRFGNLIISCDGDE
jgi:N-methylhydantoinase A